jgi:SRSO17 transposase
MSEVFKHISDFIQIDPNQIIKEMNSETNNDDFKVDSKKFSHFFYEHVSQYRPYLWRNSSFRYFIAYICGLMSNEFRKNMTNIASRFLGIGCERKLSYFMSKSKNDDEGLLNEYQKDCGRTFSCKGGVFIVDSTAFKKDGDRSVGVGSQYCNVLGKVANSQSITCLIFSSKLGRAMIDFEINMLKAWFTPDYEALRKECGVPEGLEYLPKPELVLKMVHKAYHSGNFEVEYFLADSEFGRNSHFLDSLPEGLKYFVDVPCSQRVFINCTNIVTPEYSGSDGISGPKPELKLIKVKNLVDDPNFPWEESFLPDMHNDPVLVIDKCIQAVEVRDGKPGKNIWVYIRKVGGKNKYSITNAPMDASHMEVRKPALMRWPVEQCYREDKQFTGMDDYQLRSFIGFRRHILISCITHLFLMKIRKDFSPKIEILREKPVVFAPVSVDDYYEALIQHKNKIPITNPSIGDPKVNSDYPITIGVLREKIQKFLIKIYKNSAESIHLAKKIIRAKISKINNTIEKKFPKLFFSG